MQKVKWGIIGLGGIAGKFAGDLNLVENAELVAVASRTEEKAKTFAKKYGAAHYFSSYEDLLENSDCNIVYIATPHSHHYKNTLQCLEAGKHVLCEKAFAMNSAQVNAMINKAKEKNLFLMEALWSRFNPTIQKVKKLVDEGAIGKPLAVKADFCFHFEYDTAHRLIAKELAGGALLDIGIYPIFFSYLFFGKPVRMHVESEYFPNGVDKNIVMLFDYEGGEEAILNASLQYNSPSDGFVYGDKGCIRVHGRWHEANSYTLYENSVMNPITVTTDLNGLGYTYEILECHSCLRKGWNQSKLWSWENSTELMETLDAVRKHIGLDYGEIEQL